MLTFADSIETILAGFRSYVPPPSKWVAGDDRVRP